MLTCSYAFAPPLLIATGINRAYFNHISSPHALDIPVPVLYDYLLGNIPAVNITDLQPSTDLPNPILYDASGQYILPYGAVIEVLISNTDSGEHPIHFHGHQFWVSCGIYFTLTAAAT